MKTAIYFVACFGVGFLSEPSLKGLAVVACFSIAIFTSPFNKHWEAL